MYRVLLLFLVGCAFAINIQASTNDIDNDLVPNAKDRCPNTPEAVFVTQDGCTQEIKRVVYFDHAVATLDEQYLPILKETAQLINELSGYKVFISGHTDSVSDYQFNMTLSKKRALLIQEILLENRVDPSKMTIQWYGETMPVSSNITADGRSENRRVEIILK